MKRIEPLTLKAKIKGLAEESHRVRRLMRDKTGKDRSKLWDLKRWIGKEARYNLLAYALLREIPYSMIEPYSNKEYLQPHNFNYSYLLQIVQHHCRWIDKSIWTPKKVQDWIFADLYRRDAA